MILIGAPALSPLLTVTLTSRPNDRTAVTWAMAGGGHAVVTALVGVISGTPGARAAPVMPVMLVSLPRRLVFPLILVLTCLLTCLLGPGRTVDGAGAKVRIRATLVARSELWAEVVLVMPVLLVSLPRRLDFPLTLALTCPLTCLLGPGGDEDRAGAEVRIEATLVASAELGVGVVLVMPALL